MTRDDSCSADKAKTEPILQRVTTCDNRSSRLPRGPRFTRENHWIAMLSLLTAFNKTQSDKPQEGGRTV